VPGLRGRRRDALLGRALSTGGGLEARRWKRWPRRAARGATGSRSGARQAGAGGRRWNRDSGSSSGPGRDAVAGAPVMISLSELLEQPDRVQELAAAEARALLLGMASLQEALRLQALQPLATGNGRDEASAEDGWFTIPEVARRLRLAPSYCYQLARRGDLPALRTGKYVRVRAADLREWEARLGKHAPGTGSSALLQRSRRDGRRATPPAGSARPDTSRARRAAGRAPDHPRPVGTRPGADSSGGG
jgi:excisionase family DNA binding protein